jgi:uncharacterized membrane protein YhhN
MRMTTFRAARDVRLVLFLTGAAVAGLYLATVWVDVPSPAGPAWKGSGIALLGLYAFAMGARLPALGLVFCAAGDVLLEYNGLFVAGMAAFGLGHACYAATFLGTIRRHGMNRRDLPVAVIVTLAASAALAWLIPGMADLLVPSLLYFGIILLMAASAIVSKSAMAARMGALLFLVSDSLLAAGLYRGVDILPGAVWATYAAAQILLCWGFVRLHVAQRRRKSG